MSFSTSAIEAARIAVKTPMTKTAVATCGVQAKSGAMRTIRYTPAATIVAAWISAETGVGPSIASGSQTWNGNCALFPIAPR